nr:unnamed protein product [Digitaria exilis]
MRRSILETSPFLQDDCLIIECDVTVIKAIRVEGITITSGFEVQVPPSDLSENLGRFHDSKELADVTFKVKGEIVRAHKAVLAIRSPVFKAQLYGPMRGKKRTSINVEDMEPAVFKALLHFVYRDSLPAMDDLDRDENKEMIKHLLVAADRYGLERMKLLCESTLCKRLDVDSSKLEGYLRGDCLVIECDVTVIKETQVAETAATIVVQVPPPDLLDNLGKLLESEELADVRFKVKEEVVHAHRVMPAMRSPVFKAELYGPMRDRKRQHIIVEDMEPAAFKALLHFIYRDSLPDMDDLDRDENQEMIKHLLVAADRYGIERMKLVCESILCKRLDVECVADTLALADQYHCSKLKDACIGFINSSDRKDDVLTSQGYAHLKRTCPAVFIDIWEKAAKSCKI